MTVSMTTREIKPWERDLERRFGESRLSFDVTERPGEGNTIYCHEEGGNPYNMSYYMSIKNKDFDVRITHRSYRNMVSEMVDNTDHVSQTVRMLKNMGFKIEIPDPKADGSYSFNRFVKGLPRHAKSDWNRLWYEQKHEKEKETA